MAGSIGYMAHTETVAGKYFRFAAATWKSVELVRTNLRLVQSVEKTHRQLFHVTKFGLVMLIHVVEITSSMKTGVRSEQSQVCGTGFFDEPSCPKSG